jgi:uncharacterized membrane protein
MHPDKLVEQLLDQGMTEQQITDLVAQQIIRTRTKGANGQPSTNGQIAPNEDSVDAPTPSTESKDSPDPTRATAAEIFIDISDRLNDAAVDPQVIYEAAMVQLHSRFSGPMPPPHLAAAYEELLPGFMDRCMAVYEKDSEAIRRNVATTASRYDRGQGFAFFFSLASLSAGVVIAALGSPVLGTVFSGTTLVSIVGTFLYKSRRKRVRRTPQSTEPSPETPTTDSQDDSESESESQQ